LPNIVSHKLGRTSLTVSNIALGTSPLGSSPDLYGYAVDEGRALDTMRAFFSGPLNFADTSNNYGQGRSERAIGKVIRELGGIPAGKVLATKVDANPETHDFSGDRVRRSAEESLERLGIERFQLLHLHDPDLHVDFATGSRKGGAVDALVALKEQGIAESIGIATGDLQALTDYLNTDVFDVLLSHNKYTLLDRSAEPLMDACVHKGVAFLNAAPYGGGLLARGPGATTKYAYAEADEGLLKRATELEALCTRHGIPLAAAALQFSMRDDRVASTVLGTSSRTRLEQTIALAEQPISAAFWQAAEGLMASWR
jgi:D-threo-aldose 1-dehydrogenase